MWWISLRTSTLNIRCRSHTYPSLHPVPLQIAFSPNSPNRKKSYPHPFRLVCCTANECSLFSMGCPCPVQVMSPGHINNCWSSESSKQLSVLPRLMIQTTTCSTRLWLAKFGREIIAELNLLLFPRIRGFPEVIIDEILFSQQKILCIQIHDHSKSHETTPCTVEVNMSFYIVIFVLLCLSSEQPFAYTSLQFSLGVCRDLLRIRDGYL